LARLLALLPQTAPAGHDAHLLRVGGLPWETDGVDVGVGEVG